MQITIRLFAILREQAGLDRTTLELANGATVSAAREQLITRFPSTANSMTTAAVAINREYATLDAVLNDGDELAFIPPVSGGAGRA